MCLPKPRPVKRLFDLVLGTLALVLLSPVFLVTAIAVRVTMGSPILFVQDRAGLHGATFRMVKFRTMKDAIGPDGVQLDDAQRLTRFGSFLRSTSLDELPELWNVVRGEMSLVGPRPLLVDYLPLYSDEQARRHEVLPGITGWAQVNGRNAISWAEKFALDVWYVNNQKLLLDFYILILTVKKLVVREGINSDTAATYPRFTGTPPQGHGELPAEAKGCFDS